MQKHAVGKAAPRVSAEKVFDGFEGNRGVVRTKLGGIPSRDVQMIHTMFSFVIFKAHYTTQ